MRTDTPQPAARGRTRWQYALEGQPGTAPPLVPGLYLVATPIGNLGDVTLRALEVLAAADLIACEDTRRSRKLLEHYGISAPLSPYHEHNAAMMRPKLLARLAQGEAIALISDAGTPLVSDPGYKLVREAQEGGHHVTALPGPSALLAALTVSGLPTDRFLFEGFLPAKTAQRRSRIEVLKSIPATLVIFETGPRMAAALADLAAALSPREAAICRELTKLHEEVRRGDLAGLARVYAGDAEMRGEFVIVIAPPRDQADLSPTDLDALLRAALERLSVKEAVAEAAALTGAPRRLVYQRALALRGGVNGMADDPLRLRPRASADLQRSGRKPQELNRQNLKHQDLKPQDLKLQDLKPQDPKRQVAFRTGISAESRAAALLIAKGFRILARRFKSPVGEIDIVARRRSLLVFVEVKARPDLEEAAWSVTERQRARIIAAAGAWLARYPDERIRDMRFDAVLVAPGRIPRHITAAFDAGG